jgi:hypothetical protein
MKKVTITAEVIVSDKHADGTSIALEGAVNVGIQLCKATLGLIEEKVESKIEDVK